MSSFDIIYSKEIDEAFKIEKRQYLTGNLKIPQILNHINDNNVEIGISRYKDYGVEVPHYHTEVSEYHIILKGATKYVDISNGNEYNFKEGDFYIIRPNTIYIQKSLKGTEILFIKVPGKNDKVKSKITEKIKKWLEMWENKWD